MKKRMIFFALVLSLIFLSAGSIYANDIDGNFSESSDVVLYNVDSVNYEVNESSDNFASINNEHVELEDSVADDLVTKSSQSESADADDDLSNDVIDVDNAIDGVENPISEAPLENQSNNTNSSSIVSDDLTKYYQNGSQFEATFFDKNGNPLANADISFVIDGIYYDRTTNDQGLASISINLKPGSYEIISINNVTGEKVTNSILVLPTIINNDDIVMYYKNGSKYSVTVVDGNGNPLAGVEVSFNIDGVFYTKTTDENGIATLSINLRPGTYIITAIGPDGLMRSNTITVLSSIVDNDDIVMYYKNGSKYSVTVVDGNGNPLAGVEVSFNIDGVFYTKTTDENGIATLSINLRPGTYIITAIGPDGLMRSNTITVLSSIVDNDDIVMYYKNGSKYSVTVVDGNGNPLAGVEVSFNIDGVFYTKTTDENGIATLSINLRPGTYIITAIGPDGLMRSNTITVLNNLGTYIEVDDVTVVGSQKGTLTGTLYNELGNTVRNYDVILTVNGQSYTLKTDANGKIYWNINLPVGEYTATLSVAGSSVYKACTNTSLINIISGLPINVTPGDNVVNIHKNESFDVYVTDENNNPLKGITVHFVVNGVDYYITSNEKGIASLDLPEGLYQISYSIEHEGYQNASGSSYVSFVTTEETTITVENMTVSDGTNIHYSATLTAGGVPIVGKEVIFKINGNSYKAITNEKGIATIVFNLTRGTYDVSCTFAGSNKLNSASATAKIEFKKIIETIITDSGKFEFVQGSGSSFEVILTDANGNPIANQKVIITVNGDEYVKITNSKGVASLTINLGNGVYNVSYRFEGNGDYAASNGSTTIDVVSKINGNGYWVQAKDMFKVDLAALASQGVGNIFLNYYAFSLYTEASILDWIQQANDLHIKVHIWMQVFYDSGWILPVLDDGTPDYEHFNQKIEEALYYASLPGVAGIHFDYLRLPGTAYKHEGSLEAINEFVTMVTSAIREVNPNLILSAALMPEKQIDYYYGQDLAHISKYMDVIIPMIYKGNYNSGSSWISSMTKWFVENSQGAEVWVGLQGYESDYDVTNLPLDEITNDAQIAISAGASGVLIFRWGATNLVDFDSLDYNQSGDIPSGNATVTLDDIKKAATNLKNYIEEHGVMPNYVTVGDVRFSVPQFLYLMAQAIININSGNSSDIVSIDVSAPDANTGDDFHGRIYINEFLTMAQSIVDSMMANNKAPSSVSSSLGDVKYETLTYMFSKIVSYANLNNNQLPQMVYISNLLDYYNLTVTMLPSVPTSDYQYIKYVTTWLNYCPNCGYYGSLLINPKGTYEGELTCDYCGCDFCGVTGKEKISGSSVYLTRLSPSIPASEVSTDKVTVEDVINAAVTVKEYLEANGVLPDTVSINGKEYTIHQFLYLASTAIGMVHSGNFGEITVVDIDKAPNPSGDNISAKLELNDYLDLASRVASFILENGYAPNYASSSLGKISFDDLVDAFARILAFYSDNGYLPNYVSLGDFNESDIGTAGDNVTVDDVIDASVYVKGYLEAHGVLPDYVTINGKEYSIYQFLYLASVAIDMINKGDFGAITVINVDKAPSPEGAFINSNLNKTEYLDLASRVTAFILENGYAPNYASSPIGKISFDELTDAFARILAFYLENDYLPNTVSISQSGGSSSSTIAELAQKLTAGLTSTWDKANALFVWVRDNIAYETYWNTMKGAEGTLASGVGNCCDQAWLLVELARSAGLTIRFVHGYCHFTSSGNDYGHVWTQILIDGKWVVADTTSSRNSLGVVKNWNTNSYTLYGTYDILPF